MKTFRVLAFLFAIVLVLIIISAEFGLAHVWFGFFYLFPYGDAVAHMLLFGMLSFLANLGFPPTRMRRPPLLKTCLFIAILVTLEEFSQLLVPNRTFSLIDLSADYLGIFLLGEAAVALRRWKLSPVRE